MRSRPTLRLLSLAFFSLRLADPATAGHALPRSAPEAQGVSSAGILAFVEAADQRLAFSHGGWTKGRAAFGTFPVGSVAVSGAWAAEDVFTAKVCFNETPFVMTLTLHFDGDAVEVDQETNVGFGSTRRPHLVGRAE